MLSIKMVALNYTFISYKNLRAAGLSLPVTRIFLFNYYLFELPKAPMPRSDSISLSASYKISSTSVLGTGITSA